jgi:hypothetical protein
MTGITAEELELLSFFEVEPSRADEHIPWPYNDFSYRVRIGPYLVVFGIAPSYPDVSVTISFNGAEIYNFCGLSVRDVRYHKNSDHETLEIVVSEKDSIWLRLRPSIMITQRSGEA